MTGEQLARDEREEEIHVEHLVQARPALGKVRLARGGDDGVQVRLIVGPAAGLLILLRVNVGAETAVVEVAFRAAEVAAEERGVEAFLEHVEAQVAAVQPHARVTDARGGQAGGVEHGGRNVFVQERPVLHGVVQMNLVQPVKPLVLAELVEVQRQCRPVIHRPEAARRALQMDPHLAVNELVALHHRAADVGAVVLVELVEFVLLDLDAQIGHRPVPEKHFMRIVRLRRVAAGQQGQQREQRRQTPAARVPGVVRCGEHHVFDARWKR